MALTLGELTAIIDEMAPFRLAYDWDNVGLQIGDPHQRVESLLVALEVNAKAIAYAKKKNCNAILSHHPLIFGSQKSVRADNAAGRYQMDLIRSEIGLIAAHTNLDRVILGTNGAMAALLQLQDVRVLEPAEWNELYKFAVFVPRDYTAKIVEAIHRGGGGRIGNYSHCTFRSVGTGTYVPEEGSHPFAGQQGKYEEAEEDRLESVVPGQFLRRVIQEVIQAHPYEEVAYDVYPMHDPMPRYGLGVVGRVPTLTTVRALAQVLQQKCNSNLTCIAGNAGAQVKNVAIITGSAGNSLRSISRNSSDVVITGELTYHNGVDAVERGLNVITVGHAASEKIFAPHFREQLLQKQKIREANMAIEVFDTYPEPFQFVEPREPAAVPASVHSGRRKKN